MIKHPHYKNPPIQVDSTFKKLSDLGVSLLNTNKIRKYLLRYTDLPPVIWEIAEEVSRSLPGMPLALELVSDLDDPQSETLVLYLRPVQIESSLFQLLQRWNQAIAQRLEFSEAWFIINLDLRKGF